MSKHTQGPWDFSYHIQPNGCPTVGHNGLMVCMVAHSAKEPDQKETALANAALIAAAPDLLEALERLLGKAYKQNFNDAYPEICDQAELAIAKAKGESQ